MRTTCGSCPRARNAWATDANDAAARSVSDCRGSPWVSPGRRRSGSENPHFSRSHVDVSTRSSSSKSCVRLTLFVQLVRIRTAPCPTRSAGCITAARLGALACRERRPRPALGPAVTAAFVRRLPPVPAGLGAASSVALPPPKSGKRRRRAKRFSRFRRVGSANSESGSGCGPSHEPGRRRVPAALVLWEGCPPSLTNWRVRQSPIRHLSLSRAPSRRWYSRL